MTSAFKNLQITLFRRLLVEPDVLKQYEPPDLQTSIESLHVLTSKSRVDQQCLLRGRSLSWIDLGLYVPIAHPGAYHQ